MKIILGSHVPFFNINQLVGSVEEAISYGGNAFMFYTGAPQNTNRLPIDAHKTTKALQLMKEKGIDINNIIVHAPYIINLANPNNQSFAISFLKQEIQRCELLGVTKLVVHPGNHIGIGIEEGIKCIINTLNKIIIPDQKVVICLETMSGKGTECGRNFEELKKIIDSIIEKDKIDICFDTCHLHDAGYNIDDFDTVLDQFDNIIGLNKLACIHLNDSKNTKESKKDRHDNIGFGKIGFNTLIKVIDNKRTTHIPKILETPYVTFENNKSYPPYKFEIEMIKKGIFNPNLIDDIKNYYQKTN